MISRLRFWLSKKPFLYNARGVGFAVESYNPLTDNMRVRTSQFGYITGVRLMTRTDYAAIRALIEPTEGGA